MGHNAHCSVSVENASVDREPRLCQDRSMDLQVPWKALSKQGAPSSKWGVFSAKQIAFFVIVGLALVAVASRKRTRMRRLRSRHLRRPLRRLPWTQLSPQLRLHHLHRNPELRTSSNPQPRTIRNQPARQPVRLNRVTRRLGMLGSPSPRARAPSWFPGSLSQCWQVRPRPHLSSMVFRLVGRSM